MADNKTPEKKFNFFGTIGQFFKDVRAELKKVVYPTRKQLVNNTIIVLITCIVLGTFIYGLDIGFTTLSRAVLGKRASDILAEQEQNGLNTLSVDEEGNVTLDPDSDFTFDEDGNLVLKTEETEENSGVTVEVEQTPEDQTVPEGGAE